LLLLVASDKHDMVQRRVVGEDEVLGKARQERTEPSVLHLFVIVERLRKSWEQERKKKDLAVPTEKKKKKKAQSIQIHQRECHLDDTVAVWVLR
jgi:hypothetical protein